MHPLIQQSITTQQHIPFPTALTTTATIPAQEAEQLVREAIEEVVYQTKTKGAQLFQRFYENDNALFWQFRTLNATETTVKKAAFHEVGEEVMSKLRYLEQILTDKMLKRDTDKTITAFYDHVRLFFPYFDQIGTD